MRGTSPPELSLRGTRPFGVDRAAARDARAPASLRALEDHAGECGEAAAAYSGGAPAGPQPGNEHGMGPAGRGPRVRSLVAVVLPRASRRVAVRTRAGAHA